MKNAISRRALPFAHLTPNVSVFAGAAPTLVASHDVLAEVAAAKAALHFVAVNAAGSLMPFSPAITCENIFQQDIH